MKFSQWANGIAKGHRAEGAFVEQALEYVRDVACQDCVNKIEKGLLSHMSATVRHLQSPDTNPHPDDSDYAGKGRLVLRFGSPDAGKKFSKWADSIVKGRALPIGTIRTHGGVKKQKTASGWVPVKETASETANTKAKRAKVKAELRHHDQQRLMHHSEKWMLQDERERVKKEKGKGWRGDTEWEALTTAIAAHEKARHSHERAEWSISREAHQAKRTPENAAKNAAMALEWKTKAKLASEAASAASAALDQYRKDNPTQPKLPGVESTKEAPVATGNMAHIGTAQFESAVDDLHGQVSDMLGDGEKWNKWTGIDMFFDVVSDIVGRKHFENTLGVGAFPESLPLRGKPNSPALRRSIAANLKMLINSVVPDDNIPFPAT